MHDEMSSDCLSNDLDTQFESLQLQQESLPAGPGGGGGNELINKNGTEKRSRRREKDKDVSKDKELLPPPPQPTGATATVANQVINQQPTKQHQAHSLSSSSQTPAAKTLAKQEEKLINIDENCFISDDILQKQQQQFAEYEQKVNQMQQDDDEPLIPAAPGEEHHQQHPQNNYNYQENILLINELEQMQVSSPEEFCERMGFDVKDKAKNR